MSFGPFARWSDPRLYDLIASYNWSPFQCGLLLGKRSWNRSRMSEKEARYHDSIVNCLTERGYAIARSPDEDVVDITINSNHTYDSNLQAMIEDWGIQIERIIILRLAGPIQYVGDHKVPIFLATTFGEKESENGSPRIGLQEDVYIVGRVDVREPPNFELAIGVGGNRSRVRTTIRRARNMARKVDAIIPAWDAHVVQRAREAEEKRLAEVAEAAVAEPVDDELCFFVP